MNTPSYWIEKLNLTPHPAGCGYFRETYRCDQLIDLPSNNGSRNLSTAIIALVLGPHVVKFHRVKYDEILHFYHGNSNLIVHVIDHQGHLNQYRLGLTEDAELQLIIPKNLWFTIELEDKSESHFVIHGATVTPGFDFADFSVADENLLNEYPQHKALIERFI